MFKMLTRKDKILVKQVSLTGLYLLFLFLAIMSYFYGSLFRTDSRAHHLKILAVDGDNSDIGRAYQIAYQRLQGPQFISLEYGSASEYPDVNSVGKTAICSQGYWGVVYIHSGATQRLENAVAGHDSAGAPYNANDTVTYIYNGIRYPVISEAYVEAQLAALTSVATQVLYSTHGRQLLATARQNDTASVAALFDPIRPTTIVLSPATQGTRVLLNSVTMVIPPLMQFFYIMALDHISLAVGTFATWPWQNLYLLRLVGSKIFSFLAALIVTAVIYAFREGWNLSGAQFVETWLCFWFYMIISYLVMDTAIGTLVPLRFAPFFIFTWVILSVTSTLFPFELSPGFYQWAYALPAHNVWLLLIQIWSGGCVSKLKVALPVLFMWWLFGNMTSAIAVWRKCKVAQRTAAVVQSDKAASVVSEEKQSANEKAEDASGGHVIETDSNEHGRKVA